jgi:hypothetical protein
MKRGEECRASAGDPHAERRRTPTPQVTTASRIADPAGDGRLAAELDPAPGANRV